MPRTRCARLLVGLGALLAGVAVSSSLAARSSTAPPPQKSASGPRYEGVVVERTVALPAGPATRSFRFEIEADYADEVILSVTRGAVVTVRARSADGMMGIGAAMRPWTPGCRHEGAVDVCSQGEEWCGLSTGLWRATVSKRSAAPVVARVRLVFVRAVVAT